MPLVDWLKRNKVLAVILVLIGGYFFLTFTFSFLRSFAGYNSRSVSYEMAPAGANMGIGGVSADALSYSSRKATSPTYVNESVDINVPQADRKVVEESNFSLQVKEVPETLQAIKAKAESYGGFMVSSNMSRPMEAPYGTIIVRIPSSSVDDFNNFLRVNAMKVVSENLSGYDVTDQYSDIDSRLVLLKTTQARFEQMYNQAVTIEDMLRVQNEIMSLQNQIDSLIGQKKYLEDVASSVRYTIYLSSDEYSLPYAPQTSWRPEVVFKNAVRSLVGTLRGFGTLFIWFAVYAVIWLPIILIIVFGVKYFKRRKQKKTVVAPPASTQSV